MRTEGDTAGLAYGFGAFFLWGVLPVFWKWLGHVPAFEILNHRILWSALFGALLIAARIGWGPVRRTIGSRAAMLRLSASTLIIASNWLIFLWAVNNGYLLETSLGYYINPLLSVVLGIVFLSERLTRLQAVSVALAAVAVAYLTLDYGRFPWIAMALAFTFGFYGLIRKTAPVDALMGLGVETFLLLPPSLLYLGWLQSTGQAAFALDAKTTLLLAAAGPATFIPLLFFNEGARRLPLSTVGLLQYLAPTLQFLLAVFIYKETFTPAHLVSFSLIWAALGVFTFELFRLERRRRRAGLRG